MVFVVSRFFWDKRYVDSNEEETKVVIKMALKELYDAKLILHYSDLIAPLF